MNLYISGQIYYAETSPWAGAQLTATGNRFRTGRPAMPSRPVEREVASRVQARQSIHNAVRARMKSLPGLKTGFSTAKWAVSVYPAASVLCILDMVCFAHLLQVPGSWFILRSEAVVGAGCVTRPIVQVRSLVADLADVITLGECVCIFQKSYIETLWRQSSNMLFGTAIQWYNAAKRFIDSEVDSTCSTHNELWYRFHFPRQQV